MQDDDAHVFVSLLQILVDSLPQTFDSPVPEELHGALNTFVVYNRRRCVTSSARCECPSQNRAR